MSAAPYVLVDTDVASYIFRRDPRREAYEELLVGATLALTFMTVAELYQWGHNNNWGEKRFKTLQEEIGRYLLVMPPEDACERWAQVRSACRTRGRKISAQDAWNAALALHFELPLATGNVRDYGMVDGLEIWTNDPPKS